jgi:prepilin-type N-terminal cleavage/methylation domain-containing protein
MGGVMKNAGTHPFGRGGFTLLEMLVVVGLVALLSVGIAGIFNTVGETITRGRRVSELNRTAAQLERVMRADFDRMTREGFLVIRNEYANGGGDVSLFDPARFEGEPNDRPRRIDEILFFALNERGRFKTSRMPMHRDLIASSNEAQIYYGHGKSEIRPIVRNASTSTRQLPYFQPTLEYFDTGAPEEALGYDGPLPPGQVNPNRYASDWAVVRHVAPLVSPGRIKAPDGLAEMDIPPGLAGLYEPRLLMDSRIQTAMQPSAPSAFLHIARQQISVPQNIDEPAGFRENTRYSKPAAGGGLVDVIVTDLGEIRSVVNHAAYDTANLSNPVVYWPEDVDRFGTPFGFYFDPRSPSDRPHMQAWMLDAFPTNRKNEDPSQWQERPRIRFEHEPPLMSIEDDLLANPGTPRGEIERAYREADQVMLTSQVFASRCTEFIVEWSYGLVDTAAGSPTYGQLIWYGLPRYEDVNGNGAFDGNDVILAEPFDGVPAAFAVPALVAATGRPESDFAAVSKYPTRDLISMGLPAPNMTDAPSAVTEVAFFGYYDPGPGLLQNGWSASGSDPDDGSWVSNPGHPLLNPSDDRPWFWPALIRVTMTIADETDPSIEATHQMVFEVPGGGLDNE